MTEFGICEPKRVYVQNIFTQYSTPNSMIHVTRGNLQSPRCALTTVDSPNAHT